MTMKRTFKGLVAAAALACSGTLFAQGAVPEIAFDSNADFLKMPTDTYVGEIGGVGSDSRGRVFVYTRTGHPYATLGDNRTFYRGGSRMFQFDASGKFVRELGQDVYGFNAAQGLRIDAQDNVWTIDAGANQVVKFDTEGRIALVLGRKPEAIGVRSGGGGRGGAPEGRGGGDDGPAAAAPAAGRAGAAAAPAGGAGRGGRGGGAPGAGRAGGAAPGGAPAAGGAPARGAAPAAAPQAPAGAPALAGRGGGAGPGAGAAGSAFSRPTDVGVDKNGNIYVADGIGGNNRIAKFDKDGKFLKSWGSTGNGNTQFQGVKSMALDAQGNVYVADMGNKRIQVFDGEGNYKSTISGVGTPVAICISRGATPYLYSAHSGDPDGMEDAAIYKLSLDGKVLGKFGTAGRQPKQFGLVNSIDCRVDNELLVGEVANWRVQKVTLKPAR